MKFRELALLSAVAYGNLALPQATTGKIKQSGSCNTANTGVNITTEINCYGIGEEQGRKIIALLNAVLANRNSSSINAKLDELVDIAKKPVLQQTCEGNCFQGLNTGTIQQNQFGPPPAKVGWVSKNRNPGGNPPSEDISLNVDQALNYPAFQIVCDKPCELASARADGQSRVERFLTGRNGETGFVLAIPRPLGPGVEVLATVVSKSNQPINVQQVLIIPQNNITASP